MIDGEDAAFRHAQDLIAYRFYRTFPVRQPYMTRGQEWFVGGSVHQDSALHPFIQMADLVAGAGRHAIRARAPQGGWYKTHLISGTHRGKEVDISAHALSLLKTADPHDRCGSGWAAAQIVPD